jgi:hypothetical protein
MNPVYASEAQPQQEHPPILSTTTIKIIGSRNIWRSLQKPYKSKFITMCLRMFQTCVFAIAMIGTGYVLVATQAQLLHCDNIVDLCAELHPTSGRMAATCTDDTIRQCNFYKELVKDVLSTAKDIRNKICDTLNSTVFASTLAFCNVTNALKTIGVALIVLLTSNIWIVVDMCRCFAGTFWRFNASTTGFDNLNPKELRPAVQKQFDVNNDIDNNIENNIENNFDNHFENNFENHFENNFENHFENHHFENINVYEDEENVNVESGMQKSAQGVAVVGDLVTSTPCLRTIAKM